VIAASALVGVAGAAAGVTGPAGPAAAMGAAAEAASDGRTTFLPVAPTRVVDRAALGAGSMLSVDLSARGFVVPDGVTGVSVNLTVSAATATTYVSLCPGGRAVSECRQASSVNAARGADVANHSTVRLGPDRAAVDGLGLGATATTDSLQVYNATGSVLVSMDVVGLHTTRPGAGSSFRPVGPLRHPQAPLLKPGAFRTVALDGVPAGATAVAVRATASAVSDNTYLSLCPVDRSDASCRGTSTLNVRPGQDGSNMAVVPLDARGSLKVYNNRGTARLNLDVMGWYMTGSAETVLYPVGSAPSRPYAWAGGQYASFDTRDLQIPAAARAALVNVTVSGTSGYSGSTHVSVCPSALGRPACLRTSVLNVAVGEDKAGAVLLPVGPGGFSVYLDRGVARVQLQVVATYGDGQAALAVDRLVSTGRDGGCVGLASPDGWSTDLTLSADGSRVAYTTRSSAFGEPARDRVVVRDLASGRQQVLGARSPGGSGADPLTADRPHLDSSGSVAAFRRSPDPAAGAPGQAYLEDLATGAQTLLSRTVSGAPVTAGASPPVVSDDGRTVAFWSRATDIAAAPSPFPADRLVLYVYDRPSGVLSAVPGITSRLVADLDITPDGRLLALTTDVSLVPADTDGRPDVYVRDRTSGTTVLASPADGSTAVSRALRPRLSADGTKVAMEVSVLRAPDPQLPGSVVETPPQVMLRDLTTDRWTLMSSNDRSEPAEGGAGLVGIDDAGTAVVFSSAARNLGPVAGARSDAGHFLRAVSDPGARTVAPEFPYGTGPYPYFATVDASLASIAWGIVDGSVMGSFGCYAAMVRPVG